MPSRSSRTVGALLALHAGDCLGAPLEFKPHALIRSRHPGGNADFPRALTGGGVFRWAPGAATDDTDLTRAVLLAYRDSILDQNPVDLVLRAAEHCLAWYQGHWPGRTPGSAPVDIGNATARGLSRFRASHDPSTSGDGHGSAGNGSDGHGSAGNGSDGHGSAGNGSDGHGSAGNGSDGHGSAGNGSDGHGSAGNGSAGNGSLMRCLPTGLFQPDPQLLVAESRRISAITHGDHRCTVACAAYNAMVSSLVVRGSSARDAVCAGSAVAASLEGGRPGGPVHAAIELGRTISLAEVADKGPSARDFPGSCGGFVLESLTLAVAAVLDDRSLEEVLVDVVRVGQDTDTNAAIAGGLLGARDGEEAVPAEWKNALQFGKEFRDVAEAILRAQGLS
ncbi:hypothetical protein ACO1O0_008639 [Amphichorda felina]